MPHPEKITHNPPAPPHPLSSHLSNPTQWRVRYQLKCFPLKHITKKIELITVTFILISQGWCQNLSPHWQTPVVARPSSTWKGFWICLQVFCRSQTTSCLVRLSRPTPLALLLVFLLSSLMRTTSGVWRMEKVYLTFLTHTISAICSKHKSTMLEVLILLLN